ncbi:HAD-IIA family hydrolase [Caulobacter sp. RL271]|uniref:HAD hydrolase-like protein n=1 Tax=Caulobacter segnis TaxID=88688 RepID=A0ABY4ZRG7_9CAUL|nr:HAD family hydrolase [Caulobacter segnis]USQ95285.1 HAD hydrolase-like protein [Caulobacter segnis]
MMDLGDGAARLARSRAVLFDWDGCLSNGGRLLPGARELLQALGARAFILSNNSTSQPRDLVRLLADQHVRFDIDRVFLAGHQTLCRQAITAMGQSIHLVASPAMTAFAAAMGIGLSGEPRTVVLLRDTSFTFDKLEAAANALRRCGKLVVANPDLTHPGVDGAVVPETGALQAAIAACLDGAPVDIEVIGKPGPFLFETALARAGVAPHEAVMLGDNPTTDGLGARAVGVPFIQIEPGGAVDMAGLAARLLDPPIRSGTV